MLIEEYSSIWIQNFEDLKRELWPVLHNSECQIEHIGSTAVPGLAAKPIIDIDLIYDRPSEFDRIKDHLLKIGYFHNGNQGIEGREVFKRSRLTPHKVLDSIAHHLYVCHIDNGELRRHLKFRDLLRENQVYRNAYEKLKFQIAEKANQDQKDCAKLKEQMAGPFIESLLSS